MRQCKFGSCKPAEWVVIEIMLLVALCRQTGMSHHCCRVLRHMEMELVRRFGTLEDAETVRSIVGDAGGVMPPHL